MDFEVGVGNVGIEGQMGDSEEELSAWAKHEACLFSRGAKARVALHLCADTSGLFSTSSPIEPPAPQRSSFVNDDPQLLSSSPAVSSEMRRAAAASRAARVRDAIMQSKTCGPSLRDGINVANAAAAAHDLAVAPWIFAAWGASGAEPPSSRVLRAAHDAAVARIAALLPGSLGITSPTVGFVHAPRPLLIRRAAMRAEKTAGGPAAYAPTAAAAASARSRNTAPAGSTLSSFSQARRWDLREAAARAERLTLLLKGSETPHVVKGVAVQPVVSFSPPPSLSLQLFGAGGGSNEMSGVIPEKGDVIFVSCGATMRCRSSSQTNKALPGTLSNNIIAAENEEWNHVRYAESSEQKEAEDESPVAQENVTPPVRDDHVLSAPEPVPVPIFGSASWASRLASRLRAAGVRRALKKALYGAPVPLAQRAPADALRAWDPAARASTLGAPRVADEPQQVLAAARRRWSAVRAARRAAVAAPPPPPPPRPTDAPLPPRDQREPALHGVLFFGPRMLPGGRLASDAPSLVIARMRRAVSLEARAARLADPRAARAASALRTPTKLLKRRSSRGPPKSHTPIFVADVAAWKEYDTAQRDYFKAVADLARAEALARSTAAAEADARAAASSSAEFRAFYGDDRSSPMSSGSYYDDSVPSSVDGEDEEVGLVIALRRPQQAELASGSSADCGTSADKILPISPFARTARALQRARDLHLA